ncbi:MAG: hypothetical protein JNL32_07025 [Candidatus Kapabacteria bacterium]|nr:hypothetical protein [Candidatus Kapabacteria bacterium]
MIILALILITAGILSILRSGAISGRVLSPDDIFSDGGFLRVLRHIFTVRPFSGYRSDMRILLYGVAGLLLFYGGITLFIYDVYWLTATMGSR